MAVWHGYWKLNVWFVGRSDIIGNTREEDTDIIRIRLFTNFKIDGYF